jgi:hypothetical protein
VNSRFGPLRNGRRSAEIAALLGVKFLALSILYFLFFSANHQVHVDPLTARSHLLDSHP